MEIIYVVFAVIFGLALPGPIVFSPESIYEAGLTSREPPPCRALTRGERLAKGIDPKGKAATYSIDGEFICEKAIFAYGDRNSYFDFIALHSSHRAQQMAARTAALAASEPLLKDRSWIVRARSDAGAPIDRYVSSVYRHALAMAMGPGKVSAGEMDSRDENSANAASLSITTMPVQDDDILFYGTITVTGEGKTSTWQL